MSPASFYGCFIVKIQKEDKALEPKIFVVDASWNPLLGHPAFEAWKSVEVVNEVTTTDFKLKFPNFFQAQGNWTEGLDFVIKLKREAKPCALSTPQAIPVPFLSKVKEELSRMEQMQIISETCW